jgi:hypothetical protein
LKFGSLIASTASSFFMAGVIFIGWYYMDASTAAIAINASLAFALVCISVVTIKVFVFIF